MFKIHLHLPLRTLPSTLTLHHPFFSPTTRSPPPAQNSPGHASFSLDFKGKTFPVFPELEGLQASQAVKKLIVTVRRTLSGQGRPERDFVLGFEFDAYKFNFQVAMKN
jgi:hypothetical protein